MQTGRQYVSASRTRSVWKGGGGSQTEMVPVQGRGVPFHGQPFGSPGDLSCTLLYFNLKKLKCTLFHEGKLASTFSGSSVSLASVEKPCVCPCVCPRACVCTHVYMHVCVCMHVSACLHTCECIACVHARMLGPSEGRWCFPLVLYPSTCHFLTDMQSRVQAGTSRRLVI